MSALLTRLAANTIDLDPTTGQDNPTNIQANSDAIDQIFSGLVTASETASGVVELATTAECATGTATNVVGTPAGIQANFDAQVTTFAKTILDDEDAASVRSTIGAGTGSGDLVSTNNLNDLDDNATARTNLGLGNMATADKASTAQAEAGTDDTTLMTPAKTAEAIAALSTASPTGAVVAMATDSVPSGWLECDGAAVSRTTYSDLFTAIGDAFGVGDGSTTFNLPDLRGEFIRGWDHGAGVDPDAASRTDSGDGTTGDAVGTKQADEFESHTHIISSDSVNNQTGGSAHKVGVAGTMNSGTAGGNETRPRNIALMYVIKY